LQIVWVGRDAGLEVTVFSELGGAQKGGASVNQLLHYRSMVGGLSAGRKMDAVLRCVAFDIENVFKAYGQTSQIDGAIRCHRCLGLCLHPLAFIVSEYVRPGIHPLIIAFDAVQTGLYTVGRLFGCICCSLMMGHLVTP